MTKFRSIVALLLAAASGGCLTASLERYTLNQVQSSSRYEINQVLNALATVAANPDALPSYAILEDGVSRVQDMETLNAITVWTRAIGSFASQNLGVTLNREPQGQWTVDPAVEEEHIDALRRACQWVLYGPEVAYRGRPGLLTDPRQDFSPGPHFGVTDRLARLPPGWLHVGRITEVPACARYKAHCCDTWVWVMPDSTQGLAEFTLVLHDIATLDPTDGANPAPLLVTLTSKDKCGVSHQHIRMILPQFKHCIEEQINKALCQTKGDEDAKNNKGKVELQKKGAFTVQLDEGGGKPVQYQGTINAPNPPPTLQFSLKDWEHMSIPYHGKRKTTSGQGGAGAPSEPNARDTAPDATRRLPSQGRQGFQDYQQ